MSGHCHHQQQQQEQQETSHQGNETTKGHKIQCVCKVLSSCNSVKAVKMSRHLYGLAVKVCNSGVEVSGSTPGGTRILVIRELLHVHCWAWHGCGLWCLQGFQWHCQDTELNGLLVMDTVFVWWQNNNNKKKKHVTVTKTQAPASSQCWSLHRTHGAQKHNTLH